MSDGQRGFSRKLCCVSSCFSRRNSERTETDAVREHQPFIRKFTSMIPRRVAVDVESVSEFNLDDNEVAYNMNNVKRGTALIFNHMYFSEASVRNGTNKDRDDLAAVLKKLGFEVLIFNNLTTAKIFAELYRVATLKHNDSDCLIVTVMTHGSREWLYSYDGAYALKDMTRVFNDEYCPSLKGKPRLFFIQACRGSKLDSGFTVPGPYNHVPNHPETASETDALRVKKSVAILEEEFEKEFVHNQPAFDDYLIVRSTMIDYFSFRNPSNGSWFIQDLCEQLRKRGTACDILNLLIYVNWSVAQRESVDNPQGEIRLDRKKITLCTTSKLKKILLFDDKKRPKA